MKENDLESIIIKIKEEIKGSFHEESSGHDIQHLIRTTKLALRIQEKEGGDRLVVGIAAFLHDIHRIIQKETGRYCSPKDSLCKARKILENTGIKIDEYIILKILHCIEYHEEYSFTEIGKSTNELETLILQDADNLDAIGAIGVARAFSFGNANKMPIWDPQIAFKRAAFDESENDKTTINHFYSKLLKLKDNMNTKTAKDMAQQRHRFMETFLEQFFAEYSGER